MKKPRKRQDLCKMRRLLPREAFAPGCSSGLDLGQDVAFADAVVAADIRGHLAIEDHIDGGLAC